MKFYLFWSAQKDNHKITMLEELKTLEEVLAKKKLISSMYESVIFRTIIGQEI